MATQIDITKITQVYSGADGKCCCGCSGKHYYSTLGLSQMRDDDYRKTEPANEKQVKRIVKKILDLEVDGVQVYDVGYAYTAVDPDALRNGRIYIAYKE